MAAWFLSSLFSCFVPVAISLPYSIILYLFMTSILLDMSRNSKCAPVAGQIYRSLFMVGPRMIPFWKTSAIYSWFIMVKLIKVSNSNSKKTGYEDKCYLILFSLYYYNLN